MKKINLKKIENEFSEEGLKQRLAILGGKKDLSIEVIASQEMYDFIQYCISYGIYISDHEKPIEEQAKNAYHHFKSTALSQALVESARILKNK